MSGTNSQSASAHGDVVEDPAAQSDWKPCGSIHDPLCAACELALWHEGSHRDGAKTWAYGQHGVRLDTTIDRLREAWGGARVGPWRLFRTAADALAWEQEQNDLLHDDNLRLLTERNEVARRIAAEFIPGPDGQDDIDRQKLVDEWLEEGRNSTADLAKQLGTAVPRMARAEIAVEKLTSERDALQAAAGELLTAAFLLRDDPTDEMWAERFRSCAAHMAGLLPNPEGEVPS